MEQAESAAEAAHKAHKLPRQETAWFEPNLLEKEKQNQALRRGFTTLLEVRVEKLGASSIPSWRYLRGVAAPHPHPLDSVVLRTDLRTAYAPCLGNRQICLSIILCGSHVPHYLVLLLLLAALPCPPGDCEMDRPLTPYELDVTIRDFSLGSAPGHDNMLNEFLHHPGPVVRGTIRTMINNSFANGSLPGSWKMGIAIPIPKPGKDPCRPESYRPIKSLSVLPKLTEGMIHRRLSALLPHHPRQFGFTPSRSKSDVVKLV
ncbi:hypothetical protein ECC02_013893, partial [Trypanosoma cruzi]